MLLNVITWLNNRLEMEVHPQHTAGEIKEEIKRSFGTAVKDQVLSLGQIELPDTCRMSSLVTGGYVQTLHLCLSKEARRKISGVCTAGLPERLAQAPADKRILIFDFDDTLAVDGRVSEKVKAKVLKLKEQGHFLAVASFNRSVLELLRLSRMDSPFDVIIGGWSDRVTKGDIVLNVLSCFKYQASTPQSVTVFDDKEINIVDVNLEMQDLLWTDVEAVLVESPDDLLKVLDSRYFKPATPSSKTHSVSWDFTNAGDDETVSSSETVPSSPRNSASHRAKWLEQGHTDLEVPATPSPDTIRKSAIAHAEDENTTPPTARRHMSATRPSWGREKSQLDDFFPSSTGERATTSL
mmetsp:Transcript_34762/g.79303  ORF Transcript_34762/g.79303 Transcript_34762/m.79303 type:complete len:352 (-) Transcript_34762:49-1104(-)